MTSLLEFVVRMKRLLVGGNRSEIRVVRSEIGNDGDMGSERVEGRLRPGKEVKRTLIILCAILYYYEISVANSPCTSSVDPLMFVSSQMGKSMNDVNNPG